MIYLTTGQPGAGKTLWTIAYIKQLAERENRPVYYSGISDLKLPWIELDKPEEWFKLPQGSIIVIDEAQRLFRPRGTGSSTPEYVAQLETHRHHGFDIFVITQHPMLVESNVRRLVGKHWHVMRAFGMHRATVHEFTNIKDNPDKSRTGSIRHEWKYPPEVFSFYKSAELHTHKRSIPVRVWMLIGIPFVIVPLVWFLVVRLNPANAPASRLAETPKAFEQGGRQDVSRPLTTGEYVSLQIPRINDLPQSAPRYDEITQPVSAPKPVSCVESASRGCKCFSQQATPLAVSDNTCRMIVKQGWFDDTQASAYKDVAPTLERQLPQTAPPVREDGGVSLS